MGMSPSADALADQHLVDQLDAQLRELVRREAVDPQREGAVVRRLAESVVRAHDERSLTGTVLPVPDPRVRTEDGILGGEVPSPASPPAGCYFHPRCRHAQARCSAEAPVLREVTPGHWAACHLHDSGPTFRLGAPAVV